MQSIKEVMKGIVQKVGERTCDTCGETVPIYERKGQQHSVCLNCDTKKVKSEAETYYHERQKKKMDNLIGEFEVVPHELKGATFEGYQPSTQTQHQAKTTSIKFTEGDIEENTLFFQGSPGIGKTHLSYCIANAFKEQGKAVLFIDLPSVMTIIRGTYNRHSNHSQEQFMHLVQQVELLILDDVGAEYVKQDPNGLESWGADILFQIVNARQGKKNVYTTNYTGEKLSQKYGMLSSRIISRLMNDAKVIKLEGPDNRMGGVKK